MRRRVDREPDGARYHGAPTLLASLAFLVASLAGVPAAGAQDADLTGEWRAGPLNIRYEISEWGPDCGPRPPARTSEPGGAVSVSRQGDVLALRGAVQWTTNTCASETPGLRRVSTSYHGQQWTTSCRTPDGHAHPERGVYRLAATADGDLSYSETTHWNWALRASTCVATRTARRRLLRPQSATPPPEPSMEEPPAPRCTPGAPARVALSPAHVSVEPGGRQCFRARVVDASGCPVPSARVELRAEPAGHGRLDGRCFTASTSSAEAEGVVTVRASAAGLSASAELTVRSADLSDLRAAGRTGGGLSSGGEAEAEGASGVEARVGEGSQLLLWIGLGVAALLLVVGLLAAVLASKRRRRAPPATVEESAVDEPHAEEVEPAPAATAPAPPIEPGEDLICPTCRRGYPPGSRFCPTDSSELMTYSEYRSRDAAPQERVCPKCGTRYPAGTTFCGADGTPLG